MAAREPASVTTSGFRVVSGRAAHAFVLPKDVRLVRTWRDGGRDLIYSRYQQYARPLNVLVEGGQLTVVRRGARIELVIGAHYPSVEISNRLLVDGARAAVRALGNRTLFGNVPQVVRNAIVSRTELRLDPETGRLFHRVASGAPGLYVINEIDAETGAVLDSWNAIAHANGMGTGVKGDRKSLLGEDPGTGDDLTRYVSGAWRMQTTDLRIATYDAEGDYFYDSGIPLMRDSDNDWAAASQRVAVDAHYYGRLTDDYFLDPSNVGGFDLIDDCSGVETDYGPLRVVVHFDETPYDGFGYDNAFFDPGTGDLVFGDGDGVTTRGFSGGQDIVSHEMSHRVTECRAPLRYRGEPGAMNEAFSDIMATAMEWKFAEPTSSNCPRASGQQGCPDWWVGEDVIVGGSPFGFRSLADPEAGNQPGHWQDRVSLTSNYDYGGVHINSTIPSHAFYLMANGGQNGRCSGPTDPQTDCEVVVPPVPLEDVAQIFFAAWGTLPYTSTFCDAHDATVAQAELLFPGSNLHRTAAELAWAAVGRGQTACHGPQPISLNARSLFLAPGGTGDLAATVASGFTNVAVAGIEPATATIDSTPTGATIGIAVPADMADGRYPIVVSAAEGSTTRYAYGALVVDGTPPVGGVSDVRLGNSGQISVNGVMPLRVTWSATDTASGVANSQLEASHNGGAYGAVASGGTGGTSTVITGAATESFQVTATDALGNDFTSAPSGPWGIGRFQERAATYKGAWSATPASQTWGSVRYASKAGATVRFSFNGTDVAWISTRGPKRGKVKIYLDGVLKGKVDLYSSASFARRISYTATGLTSGPHRLKIVVLGTRGRPRVDIDGFVVLSQPSP